MADRREPGVEQELEHDELLPADARPASDMGAGYDEAERAGEVSTSDRDDEDPPPPGIADVYRSGS